MAYLDDLLAVVGSPLVMAPEWLCDAAVLAETHVLSFYDASWAAAAAALGVSLERRPPAAVRRASRNAVGRRLAA